MVATLTFTLEAGPLPAKQARAAFFRPAVIVLLLLVPAPAVIWWITRMPPVREDYGVYDDNGKLEYPVDYDWKMLTILMGVLAFVVTIFFVVALGASIRQGRDKLWNIHIADEVVSIKYRLHHEHYPLIGVEWVNRTHKTFSFFDGWRSREVHELVLAFVMNGVQCRRVFNQNAVRFLQDSEPYVTFPQADEYPSFVNDTEVEFYLGKPVIYCPDPTKPPELQ